LSRSSSSSSSNARTSRGAKEEDEMRAALPPLSLFHTQCSPFSPILSLSPTHTLASYCALPFSLHHAMLVCYGRDAPPPQTNKTTHPTPPPLALGFTAVYLLAAIKQHCLLRGASLSPRLSPRPFRVSVSDVQPGAFLFLFSFTLFIYVLFQPSTVVDSGRGRQECDPDAESNWCSS
jgi:hypothetical protein